MGFEPTEDLRPHFLSREAPSTGLGHLSPWEQASLARGPATNERPGALPSINTAVTLLAGLVPVPSRIGVAEAGLMAGLVAIGTPGGTALAAALIDRLLTYYLPPV